MRLRVCPFSVAVFFGTAAYITYKTRQAQNNKKSETDDNDTDDKKNTASKSSSASTRKVVFVLGPPGAGKGTQCQLLEQRLKWKHLSAGDLLRAERKKGGQLGDLINARIAAGALVPSEVTCQLLLNAMDETPDQSTFLIDGFPRSFGNLDAWNQLTQQAGNIQLPFVLTFTAPEEVLTGRLLERGKTSGRVDDDLNVIRKRYQTFAAETEPIQRHYAKSNQLRIVQADQPVEKVYEQVAQLFANL